MGKQHLFKIMENLPKDITDKLPTLDQFSKNRGGAVSYIFMLCFFLYFFYNEFLKRDDCGAKIETLEKAMVQKDAYIMQLNNRVLYLETALDVKNGVIEKVGEKLGGDPSIGGLR